MFNKAQRLELEALSKELLGNPSTYRKFASRKILDGVETVTQERMVTVNRGGTQMSFKKAVARGFKKATDKDGKEIPFTREVQRGIYRNPTFDELVSSMKSGLEMKKFSEIPAVHTILLSAVKFVKGELLNVPYLVVTENQKRDYEQMAELIPEELREKMAKQVVPQGNPQMFCLDGFQFASDVVFATNRLAQAEELLVQYDAGDVPDLEVDEVQEAQA